MNEYASLRQTDMKLNWMREPPTGWMLHHGMMMGMPMSVGFSPVPAVHDEEPAIKRIKLEEDERIEKNEDPSPPHLPGAISSFSSTSEADDVTSQASANESQHEDEYGEPGSVGSSGDDILGKDSSMDVPVTTGIEPKPIFKGQKFDSYAEFFVSFQHWIQKEFHPLRTASSEKLKESDGNINEQFRYRYIVYHCAHYGQPRKRGKGARPKQNYLPCGCSGSLRVNYSFAEKVLTITTLKNEHNHPLSSEAFNTVMQKQRRSPSATDMPSPRPRLPSTEKRAESALARSQLANVPPQPQPNHIFDMQQQMQFANPAFAFFQRQQQAMAAAVLQQAAMYQKENLPSSFPAPPPNLPHPTPLAGSAPCNPLLKMLGIPSALPPTFHLPTEMASPKGEAAAPQKTATNNENEQPPTLEPQVNVNENVPESSIDDDMKYIIGLLTTIKNQGDTQFMNRVKQFILDQQK